MLDQLMHLVRKHAGDAIIKNPDIPNEKNEAAIKDASTSIAGGLQGLLAQGNVKDILNMFAGKSGGTNTVSREVSGGFIQNLMNNFGLNNRQAENVAGKVVPNVLDDMVRKTNDPADKSFDIQGIFNNLSGGQTAGFNMQSILNKLKGGKLDLDGDGDTDFQDLMTLIKGKGGGNIMDRVKGLFG